VEFPAAAIHYTRQCNLACPFCYRAKEETQDELPRDFFLDLVPHLAKLTPQIALGGGEPLLDANFVMAMEDACRASGIYLNITTNGYPLLDMDGAAIARLLRDVSMLSVSIDRSKWKRNITQYAELIRKLKKTVAIPIGANLLIDPAMFRDNGRLFLNTVVWLFEQAGVDRVFALYPKIIPGVDILPDRELYHLASTLYPHFYIDDLTRQILAQGYGGWTAPCHYGELLAIDERGFVSGCSFEKMVGRRLDHPDDVRHLVCSDFERRYGCPFLVAPQEVRDA